MLNEIFSMVFLVGWLSGAVFYWRKYSYLEWKYEERRMAAKKLYDEIYRIKLRNLSDVDKRRALGKKVNALGFVTRSYDNPLNHDPRSRVRIMLVVGISCFVAWPFLFIVPPIILKISKGFYSILNSIAFLLTGPTKAERKQRTVEEKKRKLQQMRENINMAEKDLGLELSQWEA